MTAAPSSTLDPARSGEAGDPDAPLDAPHAWLAVAAATAVHAAVVGTVGSSSVLVDGIVSAPGGTVGLATLAVVLPAIVLVLLGPAVGRWSDRRGARPALRAATVAWAGGLVAAATLPWLAAAVVCAALAIGIAGTCVITTVVADVAARFHRHRTTALGVIAAGSGLGVMVLAPLLTRVVADHGVRGAWLVDGAIGTVALLVTLPVLGTQPPQAHTAAPPTTWRRLLDDRRLRRFWAALLGATAGVMALQAFFVPAVRATGVDALDAGTMLGVTGGLMVVSRLVGPPLVRARPYWGYRLAHLMLLAVPVAWLLAAHSPTPWAVVVGVLGIAGGVRLALLPATAATAATARNHGLGALLGVLNTAHGLGAVLGPLLAAQLARPFGIHLATGLVGLAGVAAANVLLTPLDGP